MSLAVAGVVANLAGQALSGIGERQGAQAGQRAAAANAREEAAARAAEQALVEREIANTKGAMLADDGGALLSRRLGAQSRMAGFGLNPAQVRRLRIGLARTGAAQAEADTQIGMAGRQGRRRALLDADVAQVRDAQALRRTLHQTNIDQSMQAHGGFLRTYGGYLQAVGGAASGLGLGMAGGGAGGGAPALDGAPEGAPVATEARGYYNMPGIGMYRPSRGGSGGILVR
jgi:hypothetical protein